MPAAVSVARTVTNSPGERVPCCQRIGSRAQISTRPCHEPPAPAPRPGLAAPSVQRGNPGARGRCHHGGYLSNPRNAARSFSASSPAGGRPQFSARGAAMPPPPSPSGRDPRPRPGGELRRTVLPRAAGSPPNWFLELSPHHSWETRLRTPVTGRIGAQAHGRCRRWDSAFCRPVAVKTRTTPPTPETRSSLELHHKETERVPRESP